MGWMFKDKKAQWQWQFLRAALTEKAAAMRADGKRRKEEKKREKEEDKKRREEELKQKKEQQKDSATMGTKVVVQSGKRRPNWLIIVLLILVFVGLAIRFFGFSWQKLVLAIAFVIFLWIIISGFIEGDDTSILISVAFIIWGIDLLPAGLPLLGWLGPPYAGFKFDLSGFLNTNWAAVITSIVIFIFLFFGMIYDLAKRHVWRFIISLSLILVINQFVNNYYTFQLNRYRYVNYIFLAIIIGIFILLYFFKDKIQGTDFADYPTFMFMALVFSFFWINIGWVRNTRALLHVIFILIFGFFYVARKEQENPSFWHIFVPLLLIADFYGYSLLWNSGIDVLRFIPIMVIIVCVYCRMRSDSSFPMRALVFILVLFLIFTVNTLGIQGGSISFVPVEGADYKDFFSQFKDKVTGIIEGRLDIATAGLYRGNVEKNRYESLGVYFSNIRAADPRFYADEAITVWGTIRSKTYTDVVIVDFNCSRWKDNRRIFGDKIYPNFNFPIFTFDEVDTECTFLPATKEEEQTKPGSNTVTFSADYNFGTDAYQKAYFMDRERYRASARENIEPLSQYGIKDKNPIPVFTNGPVEIGINVGPLVTVSEGYTIRPSIGVTLTNRQEITDKDKNVITRWDGKIKKITELIILTPPGVEIPNLKDCERPDSDPEKLKCPCSTPFVEYDETKCKKTCTETVLNPCNKACEESYEKAATGKGKESCLKECQTSNTKCEQECDFLFSTSGEGLQGNYNGYALNVDSLKFRDINKDIDKHRSFECRFNPTIAVLDNNPITTRYFRVRARYNYLIENSVQVNVEAPIVAYTAEQDLIKTVLEFKENTDIWVPGINPDLLMAIASVESGMKHCCQPGYRPGTKCIPSDERKCPPDRIINSGSSIGIMQVRYYSKNSNDQQKIQNEANGKVARLCKPGETIFDLECNIKVGTSYLMDKYRSYGQGCKNSKEYQTYASIKKACDICTSKRGEAYSSYVEGDAAARGYNGWGCDATTPKYPNTYDSDYVDKVRNALKGIKEGKVINNEIRSLFGSRTGTGADDTQDAQTNP